MSRIKLSSLVRFVPILFAIALLFCHSFGIGMVKLILVVISAGCICMRRGGICRFLGCTASSLRGLVGDP